QVAGARAVDTGVDEHDLQPFAVELPGRVGQLRRIEHVELERLRAQVAQAQPVRFGAMRRVDGPALDQVLADELQADAARRTEDQGGGHSLAGPRPPHTSSTASAVASPPPMHSDAMPRL